jgi:hypothetical protein
MSYRERQRLADIQAAIDAIRSRLQADDRSVKRRLAVPGPLELEEAVRLGHEHDAVP